MSKFKPIGEAKPPSPTRATGRCLCGDVEFEIDTPARWAWHDHSAASRQAHGAACATYVGSWRSRFRFTKGQAGVRRFDDKEAGATRSFCAHCGTPLTYERGHSPTMVNIPRALFTSGVGREPRYHIAIEQAPAWAYRDEPLAPLKGFPGVMWERPRKKKRVRIVDVI